MTTRTHSTTCASPCPSTWSFRRLCGATSSICPWATSSPWPFVELALCPMTLWHSVATRHTLTVCHRPLFNSLCDYRYHDATRWTKEGWNWVQYREVKHPVFWVCTQQCKNGCGDKGGLSSMSHCVPDAFNGSLRLYSHCHRLTRCPPPAPPLHTKIHTQGAATSLI
jgi:hypothetical protein